jgi:hypothetical protein
MAIFYEHQLVLEHSWLLILLKEIRVQIGTYSVGAEGVHIGWFQKYQAYIAMQMKVKVFLEQYKTQNGVFATTPARSFF